MRSDKLLVRLRSVGSMVADKYPRLFKLCIEPNLLMLSERESAWGQCYKTFFVRNLRIFRDKLECLSLASFSSLV